MIFSERMDRLRYQLAKADVDVALITDDDSVYYFTGYYDYLHMEFGRPTILAVFPCSFANSFLSIECPGRVHFGFSPKGLY